MLSQCAPAYAVNSSRIGDVQTKFSIDVTMGQYDSTLTESTLSSPAHAVLYHFLSLAIASYTGTNQIDRGPSGLYVQLQSIGIIVTLPEKDRIHDQTQPM